MKLVVDAGGLSALTNQRARLAELLVRGLWPAEVPTVVLTEALTGDHRRDFQTNRLLKPARYGTSTSPGRARLRACVHPQVEPKASRPWTLSS